jgi:hypothetical protein
MVERAEKLLRGQDLFEVVEVASPLELELVGVAVLLELIVLIVAVVVVVLIVVIVVIGLLGVIEAVGGRREC